MFVFDNVILNVALMLMKVVILRRNKSCRNTIKGLVILFGDSCYKVELQSASECIFQKVHMDIGITGCIVALFSLFCKDLICLDITVQIILCPIL